MDDIEIFSSRVTKFVSVIVILAVWIPTIRGLDECVINVRRDLANNGPVPINLTTNQIVSPDYSGHIRLNPKQSMHLICFDVFNQTQHQILNISCHKQQYFIVNDKLLNLPPIPISYIKCRSPVRTDILITAEEVHHIRNVRFGFANPTGFANIIDIYLNITELRPLLVHHILGPGATRAFTVSNGQRFSFRQDNLFPAETRVLYTRASQRLTICDTLLNITEIECEMYFGGSQMFLARGHLGPAADFEYRAGYWASFSFANAAPQWQSINNGHWSSIERNVRQMAQRVRRPLDVITGTLGVLQLNNGNGVPTNITLNVNGQLPVPAIFYKLIIDQNAKRAVAVIILNNPFKSAETKKLICKDQTKYIEWISLLYVGSGGQRRRVDRTTDEFRGRGFVYTCRLDDFLLNVQTVPFLDVWRDQQFKLLIK